MFEVDDVENDDVRIEQIVRAYCIKFDAIHAYRTAIDPTADAKKCKAEVRKALKTAHGKRVLEQVNAMRAKSYELSAERIEQELMAIAFARPDHFMDVEVNEVYKESDEGEEDAVTQVEIIPKPLEEIDPFYLPAISQIKQGRDGITISTHNKQTALEMLGRRHAQFRPTQAVQSEQTVYSFQMDYGNPEDENIPSETSNSTGDENQGSGAHTSGDGADS